MAELFAENFSEVNLFKSYHSFLDLQPASEIKIPSSLHHIWLTNPEKPQQISAKQVEAIIATAELLLTDQVNHFVYNIWTNIRSLESFDRITTHSNIAVRSIEELNLSQLQENLITHLISNQYWGMASDYLRYIIVEQQGGVYADLGAEFYRSPGLDLFKWDFFANEWHGYLAANNFFAARAHHPIMQCLVNTVTDNLSDFVEGTTDFNCLDLQGSPDKMLCIKDMTTILTAEPFSECIVEQLVNRLQSSNVTTYDVVIPHSKYSNHKNEIFDRHIVDKKCYQEDWVVENYGICSDESFLIGQDPIGGESWY